MHNGDTRSILIVKKTENHVKRWFSASDIQFFVVMVAIAIAGLFLLNVAHAGQCRQQIKKALKDGKKEHDEAHKNMANAAKNAAAGANNNASQMGRAAAQRHGFNSAGGAAGAADQGCQGVTQAAAPAAMKLNNLRQKVMQLPQKEQDPIKKQKCQQQAQKAAKQLGAWRNDLAGNALSGSACSGKGKENAKKNEGKGGGMPQIPQMPKNEPKQPEQKPEDMFAQPEQKPEIGSAKLDDGKFAQVGIGEKREGKNSTNPTDGVFDPITPSTDTGGASDVSGTEEDPFAQFAGQGGGTGGGGSGASSIGGVGGSGGGLGEGDDGSGSSRAKELDKEENLAYSGGGGGGGANSFFSSVGDEADADSSFEDFVDGLEGEEEEENLIDATEEGGRSWASTQDGSSLFELNRAILHRKYATGQI